MFQDRSWLKLIFLLSGSNIAYLCTTPVLIFNARNAPETEVDIDIVVINNRMTLSTKERVGALSKASVTF